MRALIYVTIGHEGRRMQTRSYRYVNVKRLTTKKLWNQFEATFIRPGNIKYDRYLLLTWKQQKKETVEQFHLALKELSDYYNLGTLRRSIDTEHFHSVHERYGSTEGITQENGDPNSNFYSKWCLQSADHNSRR